MVVKELIQRFELVKNRNPLHDNELLDYIQKSYLDGELSLVDYKNLFCELDKRGAKKPESFIVRTSPFHFENVDEVL